MDKKMMELQEKEIIAKNQLQFANNPETIQNALLVSEKARQVIESYRIYIKKEYEYQLAVEEKDRYLKILQEIDKISKQI